MNFPKKISRRTTLNALGAAVLLPALDIMRPFTTKTIVESKNTSRLAYIYFPNGIPRGTWHPQKVARNGKLLKLNEWMSPLEPFKEDIIIPTNIWTPEGNGHGEGTATWLTGNDYDEREANAGGISVDQLAASRIGSKTLLPSLELSIQGEGFFSNSLPRNTISWSHDGIPLTREIEPRVVFDRMFRPLSSGVSNQSVIDMVLADAKSLRKYVSNADQHRLGEYFDSIRALEKRIEFAEEQTLKMQGDKALTDALTRPKPGIPSNHSEYVKLMMDMIVLAFWANATRVVTFMLDHGQSNRYFNFIEGVKGTWHALSHYGNASGKTEDDDGTTSWDSVESKRKMYAEVNRWHHSQFAYLLGRLKNIREPNGSTLLDNSMILYGSSLGDGDEHDETDLPTIIAGRGCGTIRTGRQLKFYKRTDLSRLHLSFLQRVGLNINEFGTGLQAINELAR